MSAQSFPFLVIICAGAWLGWRGLRSHSAALSLGRVVDAVLVALGGALLGGRAVHVLLNWSWYGDHLDEIPALAGGGVDWHGAVLGGLLGLWLGARWWLPRGAFHLLLETCAPLLPLLALAGWSLCAAAGCGSGAEVDTLARYPAWAVAELPDVYGIVAPRWHTPRFGMALALLTFTVWALCAWRGWLRGARFGLLLALLGAGMFGIGFVRGDAAPLWAGLRADQWLDAAVVGVGAAIISRRGKPNQSL